MLGSPLCPSPRPAPCLSVWGGIIIRTRVLAPVCVPRTARLQEQSIIAHMELHGLIRVPDDAHAQARMAPHAAHAVRMPRVLGRTCCQLTKF